MNKVHIPTLQPNPEGRPLGPLMRMLDFLRIQQFLEAGQAEYLKAVISNASPNPQVDGFDATLTAGLGVSIAHGIALDLEGLLYTSAAAPVVVAMAAADPAQPRIDLIVASIEANVPAEMETRDYRELLSHADRLAGVVPLQQPYEVPTVLLMKATIAVRQGVAAAVPVAPALQAGDVPLWQVRVNAGAAALNMGNLTDVRNLISIFNVTPNTGLAKVGRHTLAGVPATQVVQGMMSALDKTLLDTATAAATANALAKRDANADLSVRDLTATRDVKATRNHVFSDNSIKPSAARVEEIIEIINLATNINVGAGVPGEYVIASHSAIGSGSHPIEISIKVEDFTNIPICFEAVCAPNVALGSIYLQLYNVTDGVVLAEVSKSTQQDGTPRVGRSPAFNFTGTGRKKLQLRHHSAIDSQGGCVTALWRARLILLPTFTTCGTNALAACPV